MTNQKRKMLDELNLMEQELYKHAQIICFLMESHIKEYGKPIPLTDEEFNILRILTYLAQKIVKLEQNRDLN